MDLVIIFILGLIVGSFLNAVIFRLGKNESFVTGRSHCMHCHHELSAWDLIPVFSFIMLGGKCRYCHRSISWQYPTIELATAGTFVLLARNYQLPITNYQFWFELVIAGIFIVIAVYDFKHYLILDKVVFPALAVITLWNIFTGNFLSGLMGALLVSGFFAFQYFVSAGRWIGFGDVKFGLVLGSLFGVKQGIVMLVIAYFLGALAGIVLIAMNRKHLGSKLPFGVFLSISAIIMLVYGEKITSWYMSLIGIS